MAIRIALLPISEISGGTTLLPHHDDFVPVGNGRRETIDIETYSKFAWRSVSRQNEPDFVQEVHAVLLKWKFWKAGRLVKLVDLFQAL
jgi:hypothetical protein